jgi:hypothetical protein
MRKNLNRPTATLPQILANPAIASALTATTPSIHKFEDAYFDMTTEFDPTAEAIGISPLQYLEDELNKRECELWKFQCCILRCQEGKTFQCLKKIEQYLEQEKENRLLGDSIHLIATMNILENNKQFTLRCIKKFQDTYGKKSIVIIASKNPFSDKDKSISEDKTTKKEKEDEIPCYKNMGELAGLFAKHIADPSIPLPRIVLGCSNKSRCRDLYDFVKYLDNDKNEKIKRVFVYYDELHKYIKLFRQQIEEFHEIRIVRGICGMTATPSPIIQSSGKWSNIKQSLLADVIALDYYGYRDMNFRVYDHLTASKGGYAAKSKWILDYIAMVLDKNPDILGPNTRSFIPAHVLRDGHGKVREIILERATNAVVVVLNGVEKTLTYYDDRGKPNTISVTSSSLELSASLAKILTDKNLDGRPLVITGFLCLGMGQTLTHETIGPFTSAILGHSDLSNDDIYQLFGRLTGRIKNWPTYIAGMTTDVYCPAAVQSRCIALEECDRQIVLEHNGEVIDLDTYYAPISGMSMEDQEHVRDGKRNYEKQEKVKKDDTDRAILEFATQEEAIAFAKEHDQRLNRRSDAIAPDELRVNGKNPSKEEILKRMWGLDSKTKKRMVPTDKGTWCVYWRPSVLPELPTELPREPS